MKNSIILFAALFLFLKLVAEGNEPKSGAKFSVEELEQHRLSYRELVQLSTNVPMEDAFIAGYFGRSADTTANGMALLLDLEYVLSDTDQLIDPKRTKIIRALLAARYDGFLKIAQIRQKLSNDLEKKSHLTKAFLKQVENVDEQCFVLMQLRLKELLGPDDLSGEKAIKMFRATLTSLKAKDSMSVKNSFESFEKMTRFGYESNQRAGKLMSEGILSKELSSAPMLVGYIGQDYNSIYRNATLLECTEIVSLILAESPSEKAAIIGAKNLVVGHLKFFLKTNHRLAAIDHFKNLVSGSTAGIERINDLKKHHLKAQSMSKKRIKNLLKNKNLRNSLDDKVKDLLASNGF